MKLLLAVLLLVVSLCNGQQYVNFKPVSVDANGYCSGNFNSEFGLGYSILIGKCFTLDSEYSHMIVTGTGENDTLVHKTYNVDKNGLASCTGTPLGSDPVYVDGNCLFYIQFNTYFSDIETFNVNVTVGDFSSIDLPPNTYVNSFSSNGCGSPNTPYLLEYLVGGITTDAGEDTVSFFCYDNIPYKQSCKNTPILQLNNNNNNNNKNNNLQSCQSIKQSTNCQSIPKTNNYLSISCSSN